MTYVCQDCGQHVIGATIHKCKSATSANRTYQAIQSGGDIEKINYISVGKTIGIWVTIDGEQVLFVKESHLREQIAKEIEAEAKRCEAIEEGRYSEEYESSRLATFNGGHIGGLTTAAAIVRRNPNV